MDRTALLAVGGGSLSGAALLVALAGSPWGVVTAYLAPLPLLACGLAFGGAGLGWAAGTGLAVTVAFGGLTVGALYGGMHVLPSCLIVRQSLRADPATDDGWKPVGDVLAELCLLIALSIGLSLWAGRGADGIEETIRTLLTSLLGVAAPSLGETDRALLVAEMLPLLPGLSGAVWLTMLVADGVAAQSLVSGRGWARRPQPRWHELRLPAWLDWALAGAAAVGLVTTGDVAYVARNLVVLLLAPYFFLGLAVVHCAIRRAATPRWLLAAFYIFLMAFFLVAAALVAALGVAEQWFGVRRRLPAVRPTRD